MKPQSTFVIGIENIEVASSVIRSLRSSASSQKRYQQYARDDNILVEGVNQLNTVIGKEKDKILEENKKQQRISDAIANFDSSMMISPDSPMGISIVSGSMQSSNPYARSPGKQVKSELSDSDDEMDTSSKHAQQKQQRNNNQHNNNHDSDDDLLDNEEDMTALFKDFVPPSQASSGRSKDFSATSSKTYTGKLHPMGTSTNTSGSMTTTAALDSAATRSGITIKPGQAIRVKPSSKNKKL
ncbi:hypothetical protein EON65_43920 [archaeon]|nr:MAG: hypothetical protein EON65_43920 [archaeon]